MRCFGRSPAGRMTDRCPRAGRGLVLPGCATARPATARQTAGGRRGPGAHATLQSLHFRCDGTRANRLRSRSLESTVSSGEPFLEEHRSLTSTVPSGAPGLRNGAVAGGRAPALGRRAPAGRYAWANGTQRRAGAPGWAPSQHRHGRGATRAGAGRGDWLCRRNARLAPPLRVIVELPGLDRSGFPLMRGSPASVLAGGLPAARLYRALRLSLGCRRAPACLGSRLPGLPPGVARLLSGQGQSGSWSVPVPVPVSARRT